MAFASLNGIDLPVKEWREEFDRTGSNRQRAFDGTLLKNERYRKRTFTARTAPLVLQEALALKAIIDADGDSWVCDQDYTGKGLEPGGTYTVNASGGKYGGDVDVNSGNLASFAFGTFSKWTLLHFKNGVQHYAVDNDGNDYAAGVATGTDVMLWVNYASGTLELEGKNTLGAAANTSYDEIYFVPAQLTATQISEWYTANNAAAFPEFPSLLLDGDAVDNVSFNVQGEVTGMEPFQVFASGSLTQYWELSFTLREV